jgi:hypothetical protein
MLMRLRFFAVPLMLGALLFAAPAHGQTDRKDYLSASEADKIRDAQMPAEKIKLFLDVAADRLKKLQYELGRSADQARLSETLNGLINGYTGAVDDATDAMNLQVEKQTDIREAVKMLQTRCKDFLQSLEKIAKDGPQLDLYKDNLDDAIDGTHDALKDADKAEKQSAPPPVRRKP